MKKLIVFILIMFASILSAQITGNKSTNILGNNLRTNIMRSTQNIRIVSTNLGNTYTRSYVLSATQALHPVVTNQSKSYTRSYVTTATGAIHVVATNESKAYTRSYGITITNGMNGRYAVVSNALINRDTIFPTDIDRYGFLNLTETGIYYNGVNQFTLSNKGASWSYYRAGKKHTVTSNKSVSLTGTNGFWYIYIDGTNGNLTASKTAWTLDDTKVTVVTIMVSNVLNPKYLLSEERHTCKIDRRTHYYEHFTEGTEPITIGTLSGITAGGVLSNEKTFALSQSVIADEDIVITIAATPDGNGITNNYPIMYRRGGTGAGSWVWTNMKVPFMYHTTGNIEYDLNGTSTAVANNRYVNTYLIAGNILGSFRTLTLQGRNVYTTLIDAKSESFSSFSIAGIPIYEFTAVYQLTWQTLNSSGLGGCRFVSAQSIGANAITSTVVPVTPHNSLSGLQGGTNSQYYHFKRSEYSNFQNEYGTPGLEYTLLGSGSAYAVNAGTSTETSVIVPSHYLGFPVTEIEDYGFYASSNIIKYSFPEGIVKIGEYAFYNNFSIEEFKFGSKLKTTGPGAFYGCRKLKCIEIPSSVTNLSSGTFQNCSGLIKAEICAGIKTIQPVMFSGCGSLAQVSIPNSVTNICRYAFSGCQNLKYITIPETVNTIRSNAFAGCSVLSEVKFLRDTPPSIITNIFENSIASMKIRVPNVSAVTSYRAMTNFRHYYDRIIAGITTGGNEVSILTNKIAPVSSDVLMIEDSENGYKKKKILVSSVASKPDLVYSFPSGSQLGTAGMEEVQITNGKIIVMTFDDTTEEYVGGDMIQVPYDVKTNGNITVNFYGYARTAVSTASNKIQLKFYHSRAGTNGSSLLVSYYSNRTSGNLVTSATQGNLNMYTITNHIGMAGLKWRPGDQVRLKVSRVASSIGKLIGDWLMTLWVIRIPRQ